MTKTLTALLALFTFTTTCQAQLMDPALQKRLDAALPVLSNLEHDDALHGRDGGKRLFYTSAEIEHAQQDHADGAVGFYLSSHNRSAFRDGLPGTDFGFPWKLPGGVTETDTDGKVEVYAFKVMVLPPGKTIRVHHAALRSFFTGVNGGSFNGNRGSDVQGYDWTFPTGTRFFELLSFKDRLSVFEVRVRTKMGAGRWRVNLFRPFVTREDFAEVLNENMSNPSRQWTLSDNAFHRTRSAFSFSTTIEQVPGFKTPQEADKAMDRTFKSAFGKFWSEDTGAAPWTKAEFSIVPRNYNGAFVGNNTESCIQCHQDAGKHVRFFDANREWYGFVRGSIGEKVLSFHPIDPSAISRNGARRQVRFNQKLLDAGIITWKP